MTRGTLAGTRLLECTVLAGCRAEDALIWRRERRRCLPGAPVLLWNVAPLGGVGSGANVTALPSCGRGTLKVASAGGTTGLGIVGLVATMAGSTLRDGSLLGSGVGGEGLGGCSGCGVEGLATAVRMVVSWIKAL